MKNIVLSILLVLAYTSGLQAQLDEYKYIIVPKKFDGFKNENQFKTSTIVKHLFTQKGYTAVYVDQLPDDLKANRCLGLLVSMENKSSMFTTKTTLVLKDCSNIEVFRTLQGKSKKKEYEASYAEAIENAFRSFDAFGYNYTPKTPEKSAEPVTVSFRNDVKKLEEPSNLNKNKSPLVEQEATAERQYYKDRRPTESNYGKAEENPSETIRQVATQEQQVFESATPETTSEYRVRETSDAQPAPVMKSDIAVLYAQELSNGYQLVDSTPKIRMKLLKSSSPDVFIAESGTINGVVYAKNGQWFFEYYNANELVTEELNIKF